MFVPHGGDATLVPVADSFSFQFCHRLNPWRGDQGAAELAAPAADDANLVVSQGALGERRAHMDIGNDIDAKRDHVAHHGAHLVVALAARPARVDRFGIDLGMDDLGIHAFLGEEARFERQRGMLNMKRMPAGVTNAQFQCFLPTSSVHEYAMSFLRKRTWIPGVATLLQWRISSPVAFSSARSRRQAEP